MGRLGVDIVESILEDHVPLISDLVLTGSGRSSIKPSHFDPENSVFLCHCHEFVVDRPVITLGSLILSQTFSPLFTSNAPCSMLSVLIAAG
jgi:hypothetical protein